MINRGLSRFGVFFLYAMSLLPFWVLYLIADFLFFILYHLIGYRRKVVNENLRNSFPEKTEAERNAIERKYYKYLADLIIETVKLISISEKELRKRMTCENPELGDYYFSQGKSILGATAHYGNWEMAAQRFGMIPSSKPIIVYKPLANKIYDDFFNHTRSRFGTEMIAMKSILKKLIEYKNERSFSIFASDQTPVKHEAHYFVNFLNQPTAVFLGIEKLAKIGDAVVVFFRIDMVKRGYYKGTIVTLCENPKETQPYEITKMHTSYLEQMIIERPEHWLWSHRRWKVKPENIQQNIEPTLEKAS